MQILQKSMLLVFYPPRRRIKKKILCNKQVLVVGSQPQEKTMAEHQKFMEDEMKEMKEHVAIMEMQLLELKREAIFQGVREKDLLKSLADDKEHA